MATYALTVSTNALGLGVISGATVVVERKRTTVNDIYPTSSLYIKKAATNASGITIIQLEADDGTVFHEVKILDTAGVLVYKNTIQMPPQVADIEDLPLNDIITESAQQAVQAKEDTEQLKQDVTQLKADTLTLKNEAQTSETNANNSATAAANSAAAALQAKNDTDQLKSDTQTLKDQAATSEANSANSESNALNYANIASASARIYTTTDIGLAATTSGQLFLVKTSDITQYNVYSNDSGSASLIGTMSIADGTILTKSAPAGKAFGISDGYDNYAVFVDNDGVFRFGTGVANNLTVTTLTATTLNGVNTTGLAVAGNVMSTDGSGFNIYDSDLNAAFNVANDGTVNAGSIVSNSLSTTTLTATTLNGSSTSNMAAAGNIIDPNNTPNGLAYSIYDQNGNAAFGIDNNGGIVLSTGTINNANINYINGVNYLSPVGFSAEINHILNYGQSLSIGYLATAVTTSQLYDNLMLNSGKTAFTPLIEPCTPNGLGETPSSVSGNVLKQLILSENGISYSQQSYQLLYTSDGVGAQSIAQLSNGASNYTNMLANIASAYALAQADGKSYNIPAMLWTQGEQDYSLGTSRSAYTAAMENLRSGIEIIAKQYGQTNALEMVCYQTSTHKVYSVSYPSIALAQLDAHKTYNHIHMACPTYHLTYNSGDNVHLTSDSGRKLGAHYGVALKRILIDGKQWQPLRPISKYKQGAIAIVKFNVPYGNLVFDTALVAANTNYGFNLFDSGGTAITINSVSIIEKDTIKIVAASTIPSGAKLQYAFYGSGTSGSVNGPRGNLRDTQGTAIIYDPSGLNYPVHNWCVMFEEVF